MEFVDTAFFTQYYVEDIRMYKELGGEIISVGSDAHTVADLGKGVADGAEIAKQAGFKYLCYFKERKPQFLIID